MMKKILFTLAVATLSTASFAQKDIGVSIDNPTAGTTIEVGVDIPTSFTITNSGSENLVATDSVYFGVYLANQNIFGNSIFLAARTNEVVAPNESWQYTLPTGAVQFATIPDGLAGDQNMCVVVFLYEGTNADPTSEQDSLNNINCVSVSLVAGDVTAGVEGIVLEGSASINVYPNPATDFVTFEVTGTNDVRNVTITNLAGQVVVNQEVVSGVANVDVSGLNSGMYIYTVYGEDKVLGSQKLMVK